MPFHLSLAFSWLANANLAAFSCSLANLFSYLDTLNWEKKQALDNQDMKWFITSEVRPPRRIRLMDVGSYFIRQF